MKNTITIAVLCTALLCPALLLAAPYGGGPAIGPYVGGFLGVTFPQNVSADTNDFFNAASYEDRVSFDPGINIGGFGGYDFGMIRLEGELSYKHGELDSIMDKNTGTRYLNVDGRLGVLAFMANTYLDLHNGTPVTPYLGGGVGFATMHLTDTFIGNAPFPTYPKGNDTVFAYQAGGGLEIALNRRMSLDLGYRYFATDTARFEDRDLSTRMKFESHNGTIGIRVKF